MTVDELRQLRGAAKLLWSGHDERAYWPDESLLFTAPRFADIRPRLAAQALGELFDEGRPYPPTLSEVAGRARQLAPRVPAASYHQLAAPDASRLPDADELARMERQRPRLRAAAAALARRGRPVSQVLPDVVDRLGVDVPPASPQPITEED